MEKVYAHREFGLEANIIGCATYELKAVKFMPEHAGKLNFYVTAADRLLKGEGDNPSIGLLVCRSMDKTLVEWSLADIQKPLGVASYQIQEVVDRTLAELELNNEEDEV